MPKLAPCKYYVGGQKYDPVEFLKKGPDEWKKLLPGIKTCDLIDFTFKSPEFRGFLNQNKTPVEFLRWEFEKSMGLRFKFPTQKSLFIKYIPSNRSLQNGEDQDISEIEFKILDEHLEILQTRQVRSTSPFQVLKTITDVIMDIFIVKDTELVWNMTSTKGFSDLFVWNCTEHFKKIEFNLTNPNPSEDIFILLENISTETLSIKTPESSTVECDCLFKCPILRLEDNSNCFKIDSFLEMECKDVEATVRKMSSKDLNAMLKCWINGGLVNLEFMEVAIRDRGFIINEKEVFEGIEIVRSSGLLPRRTSNLPGVIIPSYGWKRNTFDIFRMSDNRKATVGMSPRKLGIAVWP